MTNIDLPTLHIYTINQRIFGGEIHIFSQKMQKVRDEWGVWDFQDYQEKERPMADFSNVDYKDLPVDEIPKGA